LSFFGHAEICFVALLDASFFEGQRRTQRTR
jgi:hypothetical protein